jgi:pantoate--beta-alanine ligase
MGALHEGHLSLMNAARSLADHVVVSIFVNPTQFAPNEDFNRYPRTLDADLQLCRDAGVSLVFAPSTDEMYRPGAEAVHIDLPVLTSVLEGKHRPGHFAGVCLVVAKLFNIVTPQVACFGLKDYQQFRVIEAMTAALDMPVRIVGCPTIREPDGLAMSSRNRYLAPDERRRALSIYRALVQASAEFDTGVRDGSRLVATMRRILLDPGQLGHVPLSLDYAACVDPRSLKALDRIDNAALLAVAARVGNTRLIDNMVVGETRA